MHTKILAHSAHSVQHSARSIVRMALYKMYLLENSIVKGKYYSFHVLEILYQLKGKIVSLLKGIDIIDIKIFN